MKRWQRLSVALVTGLVAWRSVSQFGIWIFPNSSDILSGVSIATGIASGILALPKSSVPLLSTLGMALLGLGLGYLAMTTATGDGAGMAGAMLTLVSSLFAFGLAPAVATHWLFVRLVSSRAEQGREMN